MPTTSVEAICYKVRALRDGTFPLMLRLTQNRKRKYLSLGMSVEERFWDFKKNTPKRNCPDRDAILAIIERKSKQYREQITQFKVEGKDYTLETLVQRVENPVRQMNFGEYLDYFIQQLREENRLGYAEKDIKRIIELDLRTVTTYHSPYLSLGRDLFLFSYLSCGINLM